MYFKVSMRTNPKTDRYSGYYRLVESHRNYDDRVCHRTILNAGYLDKLNTDQLNLIQKILTAKVDNHDKPLFELPYTGDATGNMADSKTLEGMINKLRIKTPSSARKALVVIDAGMPPMVI